MVIGGEVPYKGYIAVSEYPSLLLEGSMTQRNSIQDAINAVNHLPRLAERAGNRATRGTSSEVRQLIQRDLRRTIRSETLKKRIFRRPSSVYVGGNPVPADHVEGAVQGSDRNYTVNGRRGNFFRLPSSGSFVFAPGKGPLMERYGPNPKQIRRALVDIAPLVDAAAERAEARISEIWLKRFDREIQTELERL